MLPYSTWHMARGEKGEEELRAKHPLQAKIFDLGRTGHQSVSSKVCNKEKTQGKKTLKRELLFPW